MTDVEFENLCRMWLNDVDKSFWTDADFVIMKKTALQTVFDKWALMLEPAYGDNVTFDVTPNTMSYDPLVIAPTCYKILRLEVAETGDKIHYVWRNQLFFYEKMNAAPPTNWTFQAKKIRLFPVSQVLIPGYLRMHFMPKFATLADYPDCLHSVAAMELVVSARLKDEKISQDANFMLQRYEDAARRALVQAQAQEPYVAALFDVAEDVDDY